MLKIIPKENLINHFKIQVSFDEVIKLEEIEWGEDVVPSLPEKQKIPHKVKDIIITFA